MRRHLFYFILILCGCSKEHADQQWLKGNLHTHSFWSDGDDFPEMVLDWYRVNGYDFVTLSDHNTVADEERWVFMRDSLRQASYEKYLERFGEEWVEHRIDSQGVYVRLKTFNEYQSKFEPELLVIPSEEITDRFERKPLHINATNIQQFIEPRGGESVVETLQNNIDAVLAQREQTGVDMIPHINHPNFGYAISLQDMVQLTGERFFELYNGHAGVHNQGDSAHISTEEMWDRINIAYTKTGKPLMFGLATDDAHNYHRFGKRFHNAGRGWIMVKSDTTEAGAIIQAMERGEFYATTGVQFKTLDTRNRALELEVQAEDGVDYEILVIGVRKDGTSPEIIQRIHDVKAKFDVTDAYLFVRMKVVSSKPHGNPIENLLYETAWTQPVKREE